MKDDDLLQNFIRSVEEELSYDGIVSVPETGLEGLENPPGLAELLRIWQVVTALVLSAISLARTTFNGTNNFPSSPDSPVSQIARIEEENPKRQETEAAQDQHDSAATERVPRIKGELFSGRHPRIRGEVFDERHPRKRAVAQNLANLKNEEGSCSPSYKGLLSPENPADSTDEEFSLGDKDVVVLQEGSAALQTSPTPQVALGEGVMACVGEEIQIQTRSGVMEKVLVNIGVDNPFPEEKIDEKPDVDHLPYITSSPRENSTTEASSSSYRCSSCQSKSENPRNLVILIDGTSNKFGTEKSNVRKLSRQIKMGGNIIEQHKHYLEGIGAYEDDDLWLPQRIGNGIKSVFEMMFACNVGKNVKDAYHWLAEKYRPGDQIYLFGFSRGAYQVRTLASMIHEVGLVTDPSRRQVERAYRTYLSVFAAKRKSPGLAIGFKKEFCWQGVRVHFVGVWDTVSSVTLMGNTHITASASVTRACHFRHALALDERRVKFMPEYFLEVNAHHGKKTPKSIEGDAKEVWFAGHHSDVGGTHVDKDNHLEDEDRETYTVHAGNVPLLWMRQEAADNGLVFQPEMFTWSPHDIRCGRTDPMNRLWKLFEIVPTPHQVSFSGTGKHKWRRHQTLPRLIIPNQQIHSSILSDYDYTPYATLGGGVGIPVVPRKAFGKMWAIELLDTQAATESLNSLLNEQQMTLGALKNVLFYLGAILNNSQTQSIAVPNLSEKTIQMRAGIHMVALAVIYDVTSNFKLSRELLRDARMTLCAILSSNNSYPLEMPILLRFLTGHETLKHFIVHEGMVPALIHALERASKDHTESLFFSVMNALFYITEDSGLRGNVIKELSPESGKIRVSLILEVKETSSLVASLEMITSLARHEGAESTLTPRADGSTAALEKIKETLKDRIIKLARTENGPVGSAAVGALHALNEPLSRDIPLSNILGYLENTLPRLDAEVDPDAAIENPSPFQNLDLPTILQVTVNGPNQLDEELMRKLVKAIESPDAHLRTLATLTLLKLSYNTVIQGFCKQNRTLYIFVTQLKRKKTSLLAAYALQKCLKLGMWTPRDFRDVPRLFVEMFRNGWFDDIVGRVEGFNIFGGLMKNDQLRERVTELGIIPALVKKFGTGDRHETRMGLIGLDILKEESRDYLTSFVNETLANLYNNRKVQRKDIKILRALARTGAGEDVIKPRMINILNHLSSALQRYAISRCQVQDAVNVLRALFSNDMLREQIRNSVEYEQFKSSHPAQG